MQDGGSSAAEDCVAHAHSDDPFWLRDGLQHCLSARPGHEGIGSMILWELVIEELSEGDISSKAELHDFGRVASGRACKSYVRLITLSICHRVAGAHHCRAPSITGCRTHMIPWNTTKHGWAFLQGSLNGNRKHFWTEARIEEECFKLDLKETLNAGRDGSSELTHPCQPALQLQQKLPARAGASCSSP